MGSSASTMNSLQILKVLENSVSHKNNILPFVHTIVGYNGRPILSKDDALTMNREWEKAPLRLELMDMRNTDTFILEIPKKHNVRLGISVKFHSEVTPLLSMEILRVDLDSPADRSGILVGDYILGIENLSSDSEEDLLEFISKNRERIIPLIVYNHGLGYVRVVDLQVGNETLFGCQIGMGELYKVPYRKWNRIEFNTEVIDKDIKSLERKQREGFLIGQKTDEELLADSEPSGMLLWSSREKTSSYSPKIQDEIRSVVVPEIRKSDSPLYVQPLDLEHINETSVVQPPSMSYEEVHGDLQTKNKASMDTASSPQLSYKAVFHREVDTDGSFDVFDGTEYFDGSLENEHYTVCESSTQMDNLRSILEASADDFDIENTLPLVCDRNEHTNLELASPETHKIAFWRDGGSKMLPIENNKIDDASVSIREILSNLDVRPSGNGSASIEFQSEIERRNAMLSRFLGARSNRIGVESVCCPVCSEPHQEREDGCRESVRAGSEHQLWDEEKENISNASSRSTVNANIYLINSIRQDEYPRSEEESLGSDVDSPPFSDPGSVV